MKRKKVIKRILWVLLTPVLLVLLLAVLLYVPPIQNWLVQRVAAIASDRTGMTITVEHVDLDFPLDLGIDGVLVVQGQDTVANISRAVAHVQLWPLLSSRVVVDELELRDACVNTMQIVGDMRVKGCVGSLTLTSPGIDLNTHTMALSHPRLRDTDLMIWMSDTAAVDTTTSEEIPWRISVDRFDIENTRFCLFVDSAARFLSPRPTMSVGLGEAQVEGADIDLGPGRYAVNHIGMSDGLLHMDSLLMLSGIALSLDSVLYHGERLQTHIGHLALRDMNSGLQLTDMHARLDMDGEGVDLKGLEARTPYSVLTADAHIVMDGNVSATLDASVGREDLLLVAADASTLPDLPLTVKGRVSGNMDRLDIEHLQVLLPSVAKVEGSGVVAGLDNLDALTTQLTLTADAYKVNPLLRQLGMPPDYQVPDGTRLTATFDTEGDLVSTDMTLSHNGGTAQVKGSIDLAKDYYEALVSVNSLNLHSFMPLDSIYHLSGDLQLSGQGFDPMTTNSTVDVSGHLHSLHYGKWALDSISFNANVENGHMKASLNSQNSLMAGTVDVTGTLTGRHLTANLETALRHFDLYAFGLARKPITVGLNGSFDLNTDQDQTHHLTAMVDNIKLNGPNGERNPEKLGVLVKTSPDTTVVRMQSGDFIVKLDAASGYEPLLARLAQLADSIGAQIDSRTIDQPALKRLLPDTRIHIESKQNNPVAEVLRRMGGISFKNLFIDLTTSPLTGVNGQALLHTLNVDSSRIDTVRVTFVEKDHGLTFNGQLTNNRRNAQMAFNVLFDGLLQEHGASFGLRYFDPQGRRALRMGAKAEMEPGGLRFRIIPERPTLGYTEFAVNSDNYLFLHDNMRLEGDVRLEADDGTRLHVYSSNQDSTLLQDLTISTHRLDLGLLTSALPVLPQVKGLLEGDYHLTMDYQHNISMVGDMVVEQMSYEGSPIGNIGSQLVYMNREDNTHAVEAQLLLDDQSIGSLEGNFAPNGTLDATLTLSRMPLSIVNGFFSDQIVGFEGYADGTVSMDTHKGSLMTNGKLTFTDGHLLSTPYGLNLRFPSEPVNIVNSRMEFNDFKLYSYNENPLTVNGSLDFSGTAQTTLDLRLSARNFQLINAKQKKESVAYGKAFVNFFARLNSERDKMHMRGRLDVLGTTDLNYILLDSPLSTDNQMDELVRFTDFTDTATVVVQRPAPQSLGLELTLNIDQGAHVRCALNADQTNYVDLQGGGDLRMRMGTDGLELRGRYTISQGKMKYSMPIIPLKTFTIHDGSYVEFTGNPDNPRLNITATERQRAAVSMEDEQTRSVLFDCGVVITRTLNDMGLEFIISAPEDMQIQNQLSSMTVEQRGKLAVTMLTTGMYLVEGNTSGFSMNGALSSFLQNEINNITAGALKTVDLQVGLDNTTGASGQSRTDYSFSFTKRFWNNRLNVQIGGKVSTGAEMQGEKQSFFDNVAMEYRLSPTGNQYLKLFYNQNKYDWLDGYTGEYGGGFIWRRKLEHLSDIFRFKNPQQPIPLRRDSTTTSQRGRSTYNLSTGEGSVDIPADSVSVHNDSIQ